VDALTDGLRAENLRDIDVQEELIDEYLVGYEVEAKTLEKVYELNKKYNKVVEDNEDVSRNINWKLVDFEFDNLFNYGNSNKVNFEELDGIIGIFGKNFSGKSSIVDGVLWTLFNSTSKNERKNLNVINQNKEDCRGKVRIQIGEKVYTVERKAKKYIKRLKGKETLEAKTELNFEVYNPVMDMTESLNGLTRTLTDANIRRQLGTLEDFSVSSLSSQHGALAFIDEGSTRRKEIIAKFLDLEQFERKFKLAKEDSIDLKGAIKRLEDRNFEEEIETALVELSDYRVSAEQNKAACSLLKVELSSLVDKHNVIKNQIENIPAEFIDIHKLLKEQQNKAYQVVELAGKIKKQTESITNKSHAVKELKEALLLIDHRKLLDDQKDIDALNASIGEIQQRLVNINKKQKLLDGIPCGDSYPRCKFISDANIAVATKEQSQNELSQATLSLGALNANEVTQQIEHYQVMKDSIQTHENNIASLKLSREKNNTLKTKTQFALKTVTEQINEYEDNKEVIENLEKLIAEQKSTTKGIKRKETQIETCEESVLESIKLVGTYEQKVENLREQKQEYQDLQREFAAYDLYMQCMHPNGIAYDVIKKKIPVINEEIAKVLANIVDFEVFFEATGNKFDIFIKHPKYEERPIEMASGAEKSLSAMAIRLALLGVSSLPTGDIFILDEPGTALDEDNMSGFIRILELIKVYFKNVLLISHLDSLKDCVDMQIVIEKKAGYARVNQ
jgi:exonuclease SbcC